MKNKDLKILAVAAIVGSSATSVNASVPTDITDLDAKTAWNYVVSLDDVDGYSTYLNSFSNTPEAEDLVKQARHKLLGLAAGNSQEIVVAQRDCGNQFECFFGGKGNEAARAFLNTYAG